MLRIPWAAVVKSLEAFLLGSGFDGAHKVVHCVMRPIKRPGPNKVGQSISLRMPKA